ncbi:MAG: cell division protein FtsZ [Candidatus Brennerbacteria bacterium]|nr:cell division protein FtsZ [Candidatus Brennerbacteria bacterium]
MKKRSVKKREPKRKKTLASRVKQGKGTFTRIKVVGVGGGGGNAVSRMMAESDRIRGVEFIAVNTDAQDLDHANAHKKIYIGRALTHGLGAGMNPEIGKQAAEENRSEIGEALDAADVVFLTAGFGGGTGTGALPVIAEVAREKGILTLAVVTRPFSFEGSQRMTIAQEGLVRLKDKVDALVVIPNDRIFSIIDKDTSVTRAFTHIDDVLKSAVKAIADLVNVPGIINIDFADIKTTLKDAGTTLIGIGVASGPERGVKAVEAAANSPLLETAMEGAKGLLFSIAGGRDLKMAEVYDIAKAIAGTLDAGARVIFGAYYDRGLSEKSIKVTVIATGFNGGWSEGNRLPLHSLFAKDAGGSPGSMKVKKEILVPAQNKKEEELREEEGDAISSAKPLSKEEAWEIPAFLRKKKRR